MLKKLMYIESDKLVGINMRIDMPN